MILFLLEPQSNGQTKQPLICVSPLFFWLCFLLFTSDFGNNRLSLFLWKTSVIESSLLALISLTRRQGFLVSPTLRSRLLWFGGEPQTSVWVALYWTKVEDSFKISKWEFFRFHKIFFFRFGCICDRICSFFDDDILNWNLATWEKSRFFYLTRENKKIVSFDGQKNSHFVINTKLFH